MCAWNRFEARAAQRRNVLVAGAILLALTRSLCPDVAVGQSSVGSTSIRPFVTAVIPVVGRGGVVGGVSIDAAGVVSRGDTDTLDLLRDLRSRSLQRIGDDLKKTSPLRKVSL